MPRSHVVRVGLATLPLVLAVTACGGGSGSGDAAAPPTTSSTPSPTPTPTESPSATQPAAGGGADIELHVTGAKTLDVSGHGAQAFCTFYFPSEHKGISIQATSGDFPGTGTWSLHVQGNDSATSNLLIAIDNTQFAGNNGDAPASADEGGTITVSDDVQQATYDMQLVNITNHDETVHVTGSVHCG